MPMASLLPKHERLFHHSALLSKKPSATQKRKEIQANSVAERQSKGTGGRLMTQRIDAQRGIHAVRSLKKSGSAGKYLTTQRREPRLAAKSTGVLSTSALLIMLYENATVPTRYTQECIKGRDFGCFFRWTRLRCWKPLRQPSSRPDERNPGLDPTIRSLEEHHPEGWEGQLTQQTSVQHLRALTKPSRGEKDHRRTTPPRNPQREISRHGKEVKRRQRALGRKIRDGEGRYLSKYMRG